MSRPINFTEEELQYILDCVVFESSVDVCMDGDDKAKNIRIMKDIVYKFRQRGQKTSPTLRLHKFEESFEESHSVFLEQSGVIDVKS